MRFPAVLGAAAAYLVPFDSEEERPLHVVPSAGDGFLETLDDAAHGIELRLAVAMVDAHLVEHEIAKEAAQQRGGHCPDDHRQDASAAAGTEVSAYVRGRGSIHV